MFFPIDNDSRQARGPVYDGLFLAIRVSILSSDQPANTPSVTFTPAKTARAAVLRSLPLLQRTAIQFYRKSGCVSCHNNSLTQMTVAAARRRHVPVNEADARQDLPFVVRDIDAARDQALQNIVSPGGTAPTVGYILMGLAAERHQPERQPTRSSVC